MTGGLEYHAMSQNYKILNVMPGDRISDFLSHASLENIRYYMFCQVAKYMLCLVAEYQIFDLAILDGSMRY